jgi:hypothetical protein
MSPESLLVIIPCWIVALTIELSVVYFLVMVAKEKNEDR